MVIIRITGILFQRRLEMGYRLDPVAGLEIKVAELKQSVVMGMGPFGDLLIGLQFVGPVRHGRMLVYFGNGRGDFIDHGQG